MYGSELSQEEIYIKIQGIKNSVSHHNNAKGPQQGSQAKNWKCKNGPKQSFHPINQ